MRVNIVLPMFYILLFNPYLSQVYFRLNECNEPDRNSNSDFRFLILKHYIFHQSYVHSPEDASPITSIFKSMVSFINS